MEKSTKVKIEWFCFFSAFTIESKLKKKLQYYFKQKVQYNKISRIRDSTKNDEKSHHSKIST